MERIRSRRKVNQNRIPHVSIFKDLLLETESSNRDDAGAAFQIHLHQVGEKHTLAVCVRRRLAHLSIKKLAVAVGPLS